MIIRSLFYAICSQVYAWKLSSFKTEYASLLSWETNINFYILWQLTWSWISRMLYMWYGDVCVYVCSVMSNSLQPRELQPTRILCPRDSPGEILEWVVTSSSSGASWPKYQTMSPASPVLPGWFFTTEPSGKAGHCSLLSCIQLFEYSQLTSNAVMVSGEKQRDSAIHIHVSILPQTLLPPRLPPMLLVYTDFSTVYCDPHTQRLWHSQ